MAEQTLNLETVPQPTEAISAGAEIAEAPPQEPICSGTLGALQIPEFRSFFGGSIAASLGMWMQVVAQGWLVVTLTDSEFLIGLVSFCALIPFLLFSLLGGVLADRLNKRYVLMVAQLLSTGMTVCVGTLIVTGNIRLWHLMVGLFCTGSIAALSVPSLEAIVPEIVGKSNLLNGIALKSAQFYLAGVIGPTVGGFLIKYIGVAGGFYLNAASMLVMVTALLATRPRYAQLPAQADSENMIQSLTGALRYVWADRLLRTVLLLAGIQTLFLVPYATLLPVFAKRTLELGPSGYGLLLAAAGGGAFAGSLLLAHRGEIRDKTRWLLAGQVASVVALAIFAGSQWLLLSLVALFCAGLAMLVFLAMGNTTLQTLAPDSLRGRIMSVWMLVCLGLWPLGSLQIGAIASLTSPAMALFGAALVTLVCASLVVLRERSLLLGLPQPERAFIVTPVPFIVARAV